MKSGTRVASLLAIAASCIAAPPLLATPIHYGASLSGSAENPPNASPGTGMVRVTVDGTVMSIAVEYSGLLATVTQAHIHCCVAPPATVGVATSLPSFPQFPSGQTGAYERVFNLTDASTFNTNFLNGNGNNGSVASASAFFLAGLASGQAYLNIHTTQFPGGEIRAFLQPVNVPEPATTALLCGGLLALAMARRQRSRHPG